MNALFLLAALAVAGPTAMQQAQDCADGKCWAARDAGGVGVQDQPPGQYPGQRSNIQFTPVQRRPTEQPPLGQAAAQSESPAQRGRLASIGDSFKALGKLALDNAAPLISGAALGAVGFMLAGPWGAVAGAVIGLMLPGLFAKMTSK